jgi:Fe-Mn family superoxide dismutase
MSNTRREFLATTTGLAATAGFMGAPLASAMAAPGNGGGEVQSYELPPLPYDYDALEPYIDEQTMRLHHDMHHAGYVRGLEKAERALAEARASGDYGEVQYWSREAAFNGGGHYLHSMFWKVMAPPDEGGGGEPEGMLRSALERDFGSFDQFKAHFSAAAGAVEGSGWGLLHLRPSDGRFVILQAENQHKLSSWGIVPVLGIDVWEHAYYLKYNNRRGDYIDAWWNVVNWNQVMENVRVTMKELPEGS